MRHAAVGTAWLLVTISSATSAIAQPCTPTSLGFDPYGPSDLAIVRSYGGTELAQAPLSTLLRLDPYVPIQGELLRQVGRAIPWWAYAGYFPYAPPMPMPDCRPLREERAPAPDTTVAITTFSEMLIELDRQRTSGGATAPTATMTRTTAPDRNSGVGIHYAGRTWIAAGPAVTFSEAEYERIGESAGFAIFRRTGTKDDVIYVPTTRGVVAPFRATR
jgi:hypothetical protein